MAEEQKRLETVNVLFNQLQQAELGTLNWMQIVDLSVACFLMSERVRLEARVKELSESKS